MSDCHRRIEMFLATLKAVGEAGDELTSQSRTALEKSLKYFREAAPKHTADEEESLFPRLRQNAAPEITQMFVEMDRLERDHKRADSLHAEVDALGKSWLAAGSLHSDERDRFRTAVGELEGIYREHIALEDTVLFPAAARTLSLEEQRHVGLEMAARRGVSPLVEIGH